MVDDTSLNDGALDGGDFTDTGADFTGAGGDATGAGADMSNIFDGLQQRAGGLVAVANSFARAMTHAFSQSSRGGRQFENVLKSLALRLSSMVLSQALRPLASGLFGGGGGSSGSSSGSSSGNQAFDGLSSDGGDSIDSGNLDFAAAMGAIKPFAAGGIIGTPTYFPLSSGGLGLAGEAGPEAIMPLARGADGRLGVASGGSSTGMNVTVHISTPDAESFRRSETYVTGQIARAVARGQRSL
jgi:phage-related minor tail protein